MISQQINIIHMISNAGLMVQFVDRLAIMYGGKIAELGPVREIFREPLHPYTEGLLTSLPGRQKAGDELRTIEGLVPDLIHPPSGCRFHPRCLMAEEVCEREVPGLMIEPISQLTGFTVAPRVILWPQ